MAVQFHSFVVIGAMRSGSNLLQEALNRYPGLICYGELFNPHFVGRADASELWGVSKSERDADPFVLLQAMRDHAGGKLPGFRFFEGHDPRILAALLADVECAKILLRRDPLESYLSLKTAQRTGQWMLRDAGNRRRAKVRFDSAEFASYQDRQTGFYEDIGARLATEGQAAFAIAFDELLDVPRLNRVARFLGVSRQLSEFAPKLQRQNPEPVDQRVENPEDLPPPPAPLIARDVLPEVILHPVARAYDAFMQQVFAPGDAAGVARRRILTTHYQLDLPPLELARALDLTALNAAGYNRRHHRAAFHAFLRFLRSNLEGLTPVAGDVAWQLASGHSLAGADIRTGTTARYPEPFDLGSIATRQTDNLARRAYGAEYAEYGFADLAG